MRFKVKGNKKEKTYKPDYSVFMEDYFLATVAQLYKIKLQPGTQFSYSKTRDSNYELNLDQQHLNMLILGLGGGVLAMYCKNWLKNVS